MAGNVPFSKLRNISCERDVKSPSCSSEELSSVSNREYIGDVLPITRTWNKISECSSEESSQLQEQYMFTVERCLTELKRVKRNSEEMLIHVKKDIRDKMNQMSKRVKQSFEYMHVESTQHIQQKCEEIGRVLYRVEKILEEGSRELSSEVGTSTKTLKNKKFLEDALNRKSKIEAEVEAIIQKLNIKRENDEQIFMDFKEEMQQKTQIGLFTVEHSLEMWAKQGVILIEKKVTELQKSLANLQHLSKFS